MTAFVLVIEDNTALRTALIDNLEFEGYRVACADNGKDGLELALHDRPDLIVLDLMLPRMDGTAVCKALRAAGRTAPILMLTAKTQESDFVAGLDAGADDYMGKPFSVAELMARVRSALRRTQGQIASVQLGPWTFDSSTGDLVGKDSRITLPAREAALLRVLASQRGRTVTREQLADEVWGTERQPNTRTIDNLIMQLRQRIEGDPSQPRWIRTVHGLGYRLADVAEASGPPTPEGDGT